MSIRKDRKNTPQSLTLKEGCFSDKYYDSQEMMAQSINKDRLPFNESEEEILAVIIKLLSEQTPRILKLTSGEKTALEIRDQVFHHMDGKICISSMAKQANPAKQL